MPYLGNVPAEAYSQMSYQDLTGGSGTSFTLDYPVGNENEIEVFVNNVRQEPTVAYTTAGTALTMTGTIAATDDFYVVFQGKAQQTIGIPEKQTNGDYNFDSNTLYVDASADSVGIGTASPSTSHKLTLDKTSNYGGISLRQSGSQIGQLIQEGGTGNVYLDADSGSLGGSLIFRTTGGTERARVTSNGITFNGDTAAANALDDYEEGTHNVTDLSGAGLTITTNRSYYVKTGSIVNFQSSITVPSNSSGNSLELSLPFTSNIGLFFAGTGVLGYSTVSSSSYPDLSPMVNNNGSSILFYYGNGNSFSNAAASGHRLDFWVQYQRT